MQNFDIFFVQWFVHIFIIHISSGLHVHLTVKLLVISEAMTLLILMSFKSYQKPYHLINGDECDSVSNS